MKIGVYVSKSNGELFEVIGELMGCFLVRFGQNEVAAMSKKDMRKVKSVYLGSL